MATEITSTDVATAALNPSMIRGDQGEMQERPITDLLKAQAAVASKAGARNAGRGIRFSKMIQPGHTGSAREVT